MAIMSNDKKVKLYVGNMRVKKVFAGDKRVYSAGNVCTYHVDGNTYQEEIDEGASCLSPASFIVPTKSGYTFAGWSLQSGGDALTDLTMGDDPVELYVVYHVAPYTWIDGDRSAGVQPLTVSGSGSVDYIFPLDHFNLQTRSNASGQTGFGVSTNQVPTFGLTKIHITLDYYKGSGGGSQYFRVNSSAGTKYDSNGQVNGTITADISGTSWVSISAACACWPQNNPGYCRVHKVWFT